MSGVSKVIKKSNLEKLLLELFENNIEDNIEYFSIDMEGDPDLAEQDDAIEDASIDAKEIQNALESGDNEVKEAEPLLMESYQSGLYEGESERGGIQQQLHICNVLKQKYPNWEFISNRKGEQNPDITIIDPTGRQAFVEVKSREAGLVTIYDKTVRINSQDVSDFDLLAKALAKHNKINVYEKLASGKIKQINLNKLPVGSVFQAILTKGTFDLQGNPDCGRYGKLTIDKEGIAILKGKKYMFKNVYCSHKPAGFSVEHPGGKIVQAFIPRGTGDDLELNKKIYFYNDVKNTYTEIDVKGKVQDTDWVIVGGKTYLAPDGAVRPAADAGVVSSKCFSYKKSTNPETAETIVDTSTNVIEIAYKTILNHWKKENGADDYFMLVSGNEIYPFLIPGRPNVLNLPIPIFTSDVIQSVSLQTYGKGGLDAIRLAIKCDIAMSITLQSLLPKLTENKKLSSLLRYLK